MFRMLAACGALFLAVNAELSAREDKPAGPVAVIQTQAIGKLLNDARTVMEAVGGKKEVEKFNEMLTDRLGEKGLLGLDLTRPLLGTISKVVDADNPPILILVPIASEKEFLDLLKRAELDLEPVEKHKGVYTVLPPDDLNVLDRSILLRIVDKVAYVGFGMDVDDLAVAKLPKAESIYDPKETDSITIRAFIQNQPKALVEEQAEKLKAAEEQLDNLPIPEKFKGALTDVFSGLMKFVKMQNRDGDVQSFRFNLDSKTLELSIAASLKAKPGSELAKSMKAYKPTLSRFAEMASSDAAGSVLVRLPLFDESIRKAAELGLEEGLPAAKAQAPEPFHELIDEVFAGLTRTVKTGRVEVGAAVAPNKAGAYTVDFGLSFADPAKLEKLIRANATLIPGVKDSVTWEDFSVGKVKVHRIDVSKLTKDIPEVFGEKPVAYLAFAPDAIFVSFGAEAKAHMTANIKSKEAASPVLEVAMNGAKLRKLLEQLPNAPANALDKFADLNQRIVLSSLTVTGGEEFVIRWRSNLRFYLGLTKNLDE